MSTTTSAGADTVSTFARPLWDQAEDKLRELVEKGDLEAIELAIKLRPQKVEVKY